MGRVAMGLVVTSGLLILVFLAFAVILFGLGVTGVLDEKVFNTGLIHALASVQDAVMWLVGPPG